MVWLTDERLALFLAGTIVRDPHHRKSLTPRAGFEPDLNLSSGFDERSCAVVITTTPGGELYMVSYIFYLVVDPGTAVFL